MYKSSYNYTKYIAAQLREFKRVRSEQHIVYTKCKDVLYIPTYCSTKECLNIRSEKCILLSARPSQKNSILINCYFILKMSVKLQWGS